MRRLVRAARHGYHSLNPCCNGIYSMSVYYLIFYNSLTVLILVVMEYTQWAKNSGATFWMRVGLNPCCNGIYSMRVQGLLPTNLGVLILVVMEYTQWAPPEWARLQAEGLNPCCNGIYSMRINILNIKKMENSLNPCCNGIYSMSFLTWTRDKNNTQKSW